MPEAKRPLKVFLCHASTDKPKVRELYRYLRRRGINPWFDEEHLVGGQDWRVEIPKALATSDAIIICLTKNSVDKEGYIQKEIKFALDKALEMPEGRIFLIPVKFEECEVPFTLSRYQWVDLTVESGYAKMMKALKFRASQLERSTVEVSKKSVEEEIAAREAAKKAAREKKEREAAEEFARDKAEQDAAEKSRLEAEEKAQQKAAKEKAKLEAAEKVEQEKAQRELERGLKKISDDGKRRIRKIEWQHRWNSFVGEIRYRLKLLYIYRVSILILLVTFGLVVPLLLRLSNLVPEIITAFTNAPTATIGLTLASQSSINSTETFRPFEILTPSPTSTEVLVATPTSLPTEITDAKGVSMVLVPAGEFVMGSNYNPSDERPVHNVYLDGFYIDKYEVSNSLYKACVDAGVCRPPKFFGSHTNNSYYDDSQFENYPVIHTDWYMANTYCEWRNGRLPTEAEWEKAARGDLDSIIYPWGNLFDETKANFCDKNCKAPWSGDANYDDKYADTAPVDAYPGGASIYGVYNMAGNVWEWVSTLYYPYPYDVNDGREDMNASGDRVLRGGSFNNEHYRIRLSLRFQGSPASVADNFGFRCAIDANP